MPELKEVPNPSVWKAVSSYSKWFLLHECHLSWGRRVILLQLLFSDWESEIPVDLNKSINRSRSVHACTRNCYALSPLKWLMKVNKGGGERLVAIKVQQSKQRHLLRHKSIYETSPNRLQYAYHNIWIRSLKCFRALKKLEMDKSHKKIENVCSMDFAISECRIQCLGFFSCG